MKILLYMYLLLQSKMDECSYSHNQMTLWFLSKMHKGITDLPSLPHQYTFKHLYEMSVKIKNLHNIKMSCYMNINVKGVHDTEKLVKSQNVKYDIVYDVTFKLYSL